MKAEEPFYNFHLPIRAFIQDLEDYVYLLKAEKDLSELSLLICGAQVALTGLESVFSTEQKALLTKDLHVGGDH